MTIKLYFKYTPKYSPIGNGMIERKDIPEFLTNDRPVGSRSPAGVKFLTQDIYTITKTVDAGQTYVPGEILLGREVDVLAKNSRYTVTVT